MLIIADEDKIVPWAKELDFSQWAKTLNVGKNVKWSCVNGSFSIVLSTRINIVGIKKSK